MKTKELKIDKKKHLLYSKAVEKLIREHLAAKYKEEEIEDIFEKIQLQYALFLEDTPYLGGKKCTHNGPGGTYDCIMLFAYYEVLDPKPSMDELYDMNNALIVPPFKRLGHIANMNVGWMSRVISKVFKTVSKKDKKLEAKCPTGYIMNVAPYNKERGIYYRFERCPIAEFAKKHGYLDIMPAFCNSDYPALKEIHAGLIRSTTCANGDYCDYWIVGDKTRHFEEHPVIKDEKGYLTNENDGAIQ